MLPFMFLEVSGRTTDEIRENLVMVACQMIMSRSLHGGAEVCSVNDDKDVLWVVQAQTDLETFRCIGPRVTGAFFKGWGGVREGKRIFSPFRASYLVNPAEIGIDLMKICLSDPDAFLEGMKKSFSWEQFFIKIVS